MLKNTVTLPFRALGLCFPTPLSDLFSFLSPIILILNLESLSCLITYILLLTDEYSGQFYTVIPEVGNRRSDVKETVIPEPWKPWFLPL